MNRPAASLYHDIPLPGITVRGNLFLAPLAGFTDPPFRSICLEQGASMCWSEMVSAEAAARGSEKTEALMRRAENEENLVIQIFLSHYSQALRALPVILSYRPALIDINCGCPVPKVVKTGAGSALMLRPDDMADIVKTLTEASPAAVSVKFRSGWDHDSISFLSFAQKAQEAGASLLTLHPRTRSQGYSGRADWSLTAQLVQNSDVPVIGSGDADSPERVKQMLEETGAHGVMIGRGAVGNPFIFEQSKLLLTGSSYTAPDAEMLLKTIIRHLDAAIADAGEKKACREMRKHVCAYTKGLPRSAALRHDLVHAETRQEYLEILQKSPVFANLDQFSLQ